MRILSRFFGLRASRAPGLRVPHRPSRPRVCPAVSGAVGFALAVLCVAALGLSPGPAFAHAFLVRAIPPVGARVAMAPSQLTLFYTEAVVPHFCRVQVRGPGGAAVPVARPLGAPGHPRELVVRLPHLAPGRYLVSWHAVSTDTHRTEGHFAFTVIGRAFGRSP